MTGDRSGPLADLRVIDMATLFAGPTIATLLADFGADVIKIEHPRGDVQRTMGWQKSGVSLLWTFLGRNKRSVTLDLHRSEAQAIVRELVGTADVLIENFRPGVLKQWNLDYESLRKVNPKIVVASVTMYGQTGPYRDRPGYGTLAEAMSGFTYLNGHPDNPPTLPPFALADSVAGLFGVAAIMFALHWRDRTPTRPGQHIDLSLYEPLFWLLGPLASTYQQLNVVPQRQGNEAVFAAPRNVHKTKDMRWVAVSASATSSAISLMKMVGASHVVNEPWFESNDGRVQHRAQLDPIVASWIAERNLDEVMEEAVRNDVALAPIYSIEDIFKDPQYRARETITTVLDEILGPVAMQNVVPKFSATPGNVRHTGPKLGEHNEEVLIQELGHSPHEFADWVAQGIVAKPRADDSQSGEQTHEC